MNPKPTPREATQALLTQQKNKLNEEEIQRLLNESCDIISRCNTPGTNRGKAGLVVGYVQSGKTLSLTTVSSLARDNGYGMVIVLCGVTKILFKQNTDRLDKELIKSMPRRFFTSVRPPYRPDDISSSLTQWQATRNNSAHLINPALLIYVLKNQTNIRNLANALSKSRQGVHKITPTLIIDDEAHMAGLNTEHENGSESAVYAAMGQLRATLPDHTYLQYTATPQAPLLVQLADCVSPDFAVTLTPGSGYVGGKDIFSEGTSQSFTRIIPDDELPGAEGRDDSAPESLKSALLSYLVGLTDGIVQGDSLVSGKNRTMLVHPASRTNMHDAYAGYIKSLLDEYDATLGNYGEVTAKDYLKEQTKIAYDDLKSTNQELTDFDTIFSRLHEAVTMANGRIQKLNAQHVNLVDWSNYAHILVGGEVLGVGFTVEGLTTTYMPREASGGQSDSMQQRARFLGYRKSFIGLVRIFLSSDDLELYSAYTKHEEGMRDELAKMAAANKTIKEWKRNFLIHSTLRLTRANIQSLETDRHRLETRCFPKKPFACDSSNNHAVFEKIKKTFDFKLDPAYKEAWGPAQRHQSATISIQDALSLMDEFAWADADDSLTWTVSSIILKALEKHGDAGLTCKIMLMSPGSQRRSREVVDNEWTSYFQGRSPGGAADSYQGDNSLEDRSRLTIQIYDYTMKMKSADGATDRVIESVIVPVVVPTAQMIAELDLIRQQATR